MSDRPAFTDRLFAAMDDLAAYTKGEGQLRVTSVGVPDLPEFEAADVAEVRARLGMSLPRFASYLGVTTATLERWESGEAKPPRIARRLLQIIEHPQELESLTQKAA
ncbi:hypothetical protein EON79_02100 [bacterium]|nr:MAG: hypothetical protein EON79_02100 [bacterium]